MDTLIAFASICRDLPGNSCPGSSCLMHCPPYISPPTPDSRLPTPDSRLPTPDSRLPTPYSLFP
ncbi:MULTISPECIES: hypothetical protein [unclassified Moorena]|uniref:hypothetical protein n=1 Tax=unclassified Moorena TaxID=2683338 RepID=UPI0013B63C46|nr:MULTISPECIES: hypothetical protein [unclassified Moorena]NEP31632.1 hypothetical protein [Moorena sp. SIO3B2]NEQ05278.1 hypothetical protein [Moorena sp. SIO4E2]NER86109.1 hypothetical protein [Moorena sp. SIO3A2]NES41862.1 hypothetical protein [Moorena sp. SIO2C4]NET62885.1 hypothetical protein [Moorena sp. SIO1G6]